MSKVATAAKAEAAEMPAADMAPVVLKPISPLLANRWKARESGVYFNTHEVVPEPGTPIENLLRPEYWGNVSQKFRPGDTIIAFEGSWAAELLVWDAGQNFANVSVKSHMEKPEFVALAGVEPDFEVGRDPLKGVIVKRKSTGKIVKDGFANHEEARRWIIEHQRVLKR